MKLCRFNEKGIGAMVKSEKALFEDLRTLVIAARRRVAFSVNSEAVMMYWQVGMRIKTNLLKDKRAAYGEALVRKTAEFLSSEFGSGWGFQTVRHCVRAAYTFKKQDIVYALRTQLTWTHLRSLMAIDDPLKRQFYLEMCAHEHWSTREMDAKIDGMLFERTAISGKPEGLIKKELGKFKPEYEGQMKLYLRYLDKNERKHWEEPPMGLILCSEGNTEHIEYLMLDEAAKDIRVAQYYAGLPIKAVLRRKLQRAIALAQESVRERVVDLKSNRKGARK